MQFFWFYYIFFGFNSNILKVKQKSILKMSANIIQELFTKKWLSSIAIRTQSMPSTPGSQIAYNPCNQFRKYNELVFNFKFHTKIF